MCNEDFMWLEVQVFKCLRCFLIFLSICTSNYKEH